MDNCANVHIWNRRSDFIPETYVKFNQEISTAVSAVNGSSNKPAGCGDVPVSWTDDNGKEYKVILKNVLHFPDSPVKIMSVVSLAEQLKDELDTWIMSRQKFSILTWAFGKFTKTIDHGKSRLSEMLVRCTKDTVGAFTSLVETSKTASNHLVFQTSIRRDRQVLHRVASPKHFAALTPSYLEIQVWGTSASWLLASAYLSY